MSQEAFVPKIYAVRYQPVVIDSDLALLYSVETAFQGERSLGLIAADHLF